MGEPDTFPSESPARLSARLERMVATGRVTAEEADRVRTAKNDAERTAALSAIRLRHAGERVAAAVADGHITQAEADDILRRVADGHGPETLRRLLNQRTHRHDGPGHGTARREPR